MLTFGANGDTWNDLSIGLAIRFREIEYIIDSMIILVVLTLARGTLIHIILLFHHFSAIVEYGIS